MLNIGIIGAGRIGKVHLESISYHVKNAVVTAIADPFMNDETKAFCEGFGVEKIYTDYKKIIEDETIDAVLVCSSTDTHADISIEAANAGKHVFCEKPVATTLAGLDRLERVYKEGGMSSREIWVDTETGVQYFIFSAGYGLSMTPCSTPRASPFSTAAPPTPPSIEKR